MIFIYCKWGFRPVAVVGKTVQKTGKIQPYTKGEINKQNNTETQYTQNIKQTYKTRKQIYKEYYKTRVE